MGGVAEVKISIKGNENVLEALRRNGVYINAPCGGRGICEKCIVRVSGKECIACKTAPGEGEIDVEVTPYGIAIDIGTTTLAFALIDMESGAQIASYTCMNSQRAFGADVISRISFANYGNLAQLHSYIIEDILRGINVLLPECSLIVISGNTTMLHFLQNYSCETLGVYPFTPISTELAQTKVAPYATFGLPYLSAGNCECNFLCHNKVAPCVTFGLPYLSAGNCECNFLCHKKIAGCNAIILPGVSAFIGADVISGIFFCEQPTQENFNLLIDLGTNGEIALFSREKIYATSAAAGPAFGSCATRIIDICAELIRNKFIDETGLLQQETDKFTQKEIREIQLAKAAIRAGIEILLEEAGLKCENIQKVFLAGGIGYNINVNNAVTIGLIPAEFESKTKAVGNASLGGCVKYLQNPSDEIKRLAKITKEINLSTHPKFNDLFMENINFVYHTNEV